MIPYPSYPRVPVGPCIWVERRRESWPPSFVLSHHHRLASVERVCAQSPNSRWCKLSIYLRPVTGLSIWRDREACKTKNKRRRCAFWSMTKAHFPFITFVPIRRYQSLPRFSLSRRANVSLWCRMCLIWVPDCVFMVFGASDFSVPLMSAPPTGLARFHPPSPSRPQHAPYHSRATSYADPFYGQAIRVYVVTFPWIPTKTLLPFSSKLVIWHGFAADGCI
jgi:hypothetical protein